MAPPIYSELNLIWTQNNSNLPELFETAISLGYERIAINNVVECLQSGKGKKQKEKPSISPPSDILLNPASLKSLKVKSGFLEQLSRFTTILHDASNTHRLASPEVQAYDIIAVQPANEKTFQLACSTLEVDIICLNFSENLGFSLKRPLVRLAAERGIHFEITYSQALHDSSTKRYIISNALNLVSAGGGKNVIISSGAQKPIDLRSPYDVINLAKLFGMSHAQAKDSMCRNCRAILKHAESRKACKSVISVTKLTSLSDRDAKIIRSQTAKELISLRNREDNNNDEESSSGEDEEDSSEEDVGLLPPKRLKTNST